MSEVPALIDSHCHIAEAEFDADRDAVITRAIQAGVTALVCIGATGSIERNQPTVALAAASHALPIYATVGIHPHDASTADDAAFDTLRTWAGAEYVVALGETGLDYHYDHSPRPAQREAFARTIALARELDIPLVVHVRDAHEDAADMLRSESRGAVDIAIHCFTGDSDDARRYLDIGCSLSIAGVVSFKNADVLRAAVRTIPLDRLLVETDAPFLTPIPHRGRRNEPAFVKLVAETVATVRGETFATVATATAANARRFFRLSA